MQKNNKKIKMKTASNSNLKKFGYYIPIIFTIAIIPLITFGKIVELPIEEANFWKGGTTHLDFFNYYKSVLLVIVTLASSAAYGGLYLNNKLPLQKEKRYYVPMIIYTVMIIVSTVISQNKHVALVGFIEMYQGMFVLLSYMVLTFILINYTRDERDVKIIIYAFVALTIVEGIIGLSQYFGYDLFKSQFGQIIITPKVLRDINLKFAFGKYTIYGTMYNTNFVGSFGALVLPITTILYLFTKDRKRLLLFGLASMLAFSTWLGCNSRAGYLGIIFSSIVGIAVFRKIVKANYKKVLILSTGFIIITIVFNTVSDGKVLGQFSRLNPVTETEKIENVKNDQLTRFEDVSVKENTFTIKTNKETLIGLVEESKLKFTDEIGNKLGVKIGNDGYIKFIDARYSNYSFLVDQEKPSKIKAHIYGRNLDLFITPDENIKVISMNNKLTEPIKAPHIKFFDGKETFASNRGYVWSRTIPLLKNTILIGYGPDNFPMIFPQEDYVGRFNVGSNGMTDIVVDKPHNMYLQTAINTGVISLISLIVMWVLYLIDSLRKYINGNMDTFVEYMGAAIFLSITAYLVAGMFNDNIISVAPLFWILLGTGIGINKIVKN